MNDLNSVFMVGRIDKTPVIKAGADVEFYLLNNYSTYNEARKEYEQEQGRYHVIIKSHVAEKQAVVTTLKAGNKIGVNGRLMEHAVGGKSKMTRVSIVAYTIQNLSK